MTEKEIREVFQRMAKKWRSAVVTRSEIKAFSGGMFTSRVMAKVDTAGEGPPRFTSSSKTIVYPLDELVAWMIDRTLQAAKKGDPTKKAAAPGGRTPEAA